MKTGLIISGVLHGIILLLILLRLPWGGADEDDFLRVTNVTMLNESQYAAAVSQAPDMPDMDMLSMSQPQTDVNDAARPEDDTNPEETEIDITEAPSARDADPDLTAVERLAQPGVAVTAFQPVAPELSPQIAPSIGSGTAGNSVGVTLSAPPVPRAAPRISDVAAPPVPDDARQSDVNTAATTPDETAPDPVEEQPAEATPEAVTEVVPEAQPDAPPSDAPPPERIPVRRSANAEANAADIAQQIREQEEADIRALLDQAVSQATAEVEEPATTASPPTAQLSAAQSQGIGEAVSQNWNKSIVLGKENYETLVVKIAVIVGPDGAIIGDVQPIDPANPTGNFKIAYDAARRAVLRAGVIPLPAGQFPEGVRLILRFDPVLGIGLN